MGRVLLVLLQVKMGCVGWVMMVMMVMIKPWGVLANTSAISHIHPIPVYRSIMRVFCPTCRNSICTSMDWMHLYMHDDAVLLTCSLATSFLIGEGL